MLVMTSSHVAARDLLTIVAPAAPGGGWDQTARVLQQVLAQVEPGSTVQVENVPGAAGTIGLARFVTAERGNPQALLVTGLVMVSAIAITHSPVRIADTTPIARLTGEYEAIVVPAASPWREAPARPPRYATVSPEWWTPRTRACRIRCDSKGSGVSGQRSQRGRAWSDDCEPLTV